MLPPAKEGSVEAAGAVTNQTAELEKVTSSQHRIEGSEKSEENECTEHWSEIQLSNCSSSSPPSVTVTSTSSSEAQPESQAQVGSKDKGSSTEPVIKVDLQESNGTLESEAGARLVQAEVHATLENGETEDPASKDTERREREEEDEDEGSRKEDYSEGDLVDISAYSGIGEDDSGGSQLDDEEDEEDDEAYQPESSCTEITGLPEEDEPPPSNRKIRFSIEPIKVSEALYCVFVQS